MLYIIATPIGNLADLTFRALEIMKECDYLLCEDTRHSGILLKHYEIKKSLKSYHRFNEAKREAEVLEDLLNGKKIGLLSDAGTPAVADPGFRLILACQKALIPVIPLAGACAAIVALVGSGLPMDRFQFVGFLPKKKGELIKLFEEAITYPGSTVCYESPFRLKRDLAVLQEVDPERKVVIGRELTKKFEEFIIGTPLSLKDKWEDKPPKGEIVLMIAGQSDNKSLRSPKKKMEHKVLKK